MSFCKNLERTAWALSVILIPAAGTRFPIKIGKAQTIPASGLKEKPF
ncbi:hypothetical protein [Flavobacterium aquatile]|nr:hypothetical protein [Flavobacterium aquatile]